MKSAYLLVTSIKAIALACVIQGLMIAPTNASPDQPARGSYPAQIHQRCEGIFTQKVTRLQDEKEVSFCEYSKLPLLVVNTASACGFTPQYKDLEALQAKYKGKITVVGIPSNDFGGQEPKSNKEIAQFCFNTFGVSFPMLQKSKVKGPNAHPIFAWIKEKSGAEPNWNFNKFVIWNGTITHFTSEVNPLDPRIAGAMGMSK